MTALLTYCAFVGLGFMMAVFIGAVKGSCNAINAINKEYEWRDKYRNGEITDDEFMKGWENHD